MKGLELLCVTPGCITNLTNAGRVKILLLDDYTTPKQGVRKIPKPYKDTKKAHEKGIAHAIRVLGLHCAMAHDRSDVAARIVKFLGGGLGE